MSEEAKKKSTLKNWLIGCVIVLAVVLLLGAGMATYMVWGLNDYMERTPVVTSNGPIRVEIGSTISIEELVTIENADEAVVRIQGLDFSAMDPMGGAYISEDEQSVFVGNIPGTMRAYVLARGSNAETRDAEVIIEVYAKEED